MRILRNRVVLAGAALAVGVVVGACIPPVGSADQDRTYFVCAGIGGVIDPSSLRIDNTPTCSAGKTLQQWTQHGDTSDLVGVTVEMTGDDVSRPLFGTALTPWVEASGTETTLKCTSGGDCSAIVLRGTPYTLATFADTTVTQVTWTGCDQEAGDVGPQVRCLMNGTHGAHVAVDFSPRVPAS